MIEKLAMLASVTKALSESLTIEQQMAISDKITKDPHSFAAFIRTESGKKAAQEFASKFIEAK